MLQAEALKVRKIQLKPAEGAAVVQPEAAELWGVVLREAAGSQACAVQVQLLKLGEVHSTEVELGRVV